MRISDIFKMALRSMFKRKVRTFLTVLGVVVGSTSITLMMSIGVAVNMNFDDIFETHGQGALRVNVFSSGDGNLLLPEHVARIQQHPNVAISTPILEMNTSFMISHGPYQNSLNVVGLYPNALPALGLQAGEGRLLENSDSFELLLGFDVPYSFWVPTTSPSPGMGGGFIIMGGGWDDREPPTIPLLNTRFQYQATMNGRPYISEVVGILERNEQDWTFSWRSVMHIDFAREIAREVFREAEANSEMWGGWLPPNPDDGYQQIFIMADDARSVNDIVTYIQDEMGIETVFSNIQWLLMQLESAESLQAMLMAIAAVSLFIAAIMIANTMIMAIYERRKEIGVMKVIGASIRDIRFMFLLEAALIGALGGAIGLLASAGMSFVMNNLEIQFLENLTFGDGGLVSYIPPWLFGLSFSFSSIIGLISGFLPARRATKISALAAIRSD